ncbi:WD repeat-containing protein 82-like [Contarinia nasturtii]|uniref:WD repeat-containing protein 82-like n=1 Tax=Contarinia nasturtii TaxID=265458 RepID=UPI0012D435A4|nr:WD repeat-containing protein 82-like [Contarinia nasturtii]
MNDYIQNKSRIENVHDRIKMKVEAHLIRQFCVAKEFHQNAATKITAIDFSSSGEHLISCNGDDQIFIYDCEKAVQTCNINSRKYGADFIHFTRDQNAVIHSSTKVDDAIRLLSLKDNKYLWYFPGHTKKVISLCVSPVDDSFLSGSIDNTLRLWDLRTKNCQAILRSPGRTIAAYDPDGLVFAAGMNSEMIKLYDLRSFDKGPFETFNLNTKSEWTGLKFSKNGKTILISTAGQIIHMIDAFDGVRHAPLKNFIGHSNYMKLPIEASFSPNSQYIFAGSDDGRIHCWDADTGFKVCALNGGQGQTTPVQCVQFNPKLMMLASACKNVTWWCPSLEDPTQ